MLRKVQAVEARLVGRDREFEPLVECRRNRPVGTLDMVEESDLHFFSCGLRRNQFPRRASAPY